jgi:hypothetical protein
MNTQIRKPQLMESLEVTAKVENLMQERHCDHVVESIAVAAEVVIRAGMQKVPDESGKGNGLSLFIP